MTDSRHSRWRGDEWFGGCRDPSGRMSVGAIWGQGVLGSSECSDHVGGGGIE